MPTSTSHSGILEVPMGLEPSDVLFIAIVIWLAIEIINGGGGGRRSRRSRCARIRRTAPASRGSIPRLGGSSRLIEPRPARSGQRPGCHACSGVPLPDVIVVGGGLAGLAAAAALCAAGSFRQTLRSAPLPGRPRHLLRDRFGDHRQLPAHPAALLRQPAGFLRPARRRERHRVSIAKFSSSSPADARSTLRAGHAARADSLRRIVSAR